VTIAKICNLEMIEPNLFEDVAEWVARCQTYEGGFGATPFNEAHGGYCFCGLAALKLLGKEALCDIDLLTYWLVNKQMKFEGGFQGRTNKLVDSCYSFWQGGMFPIIHSILAKESTYLQENKNWLFEREMLQSYILICCQLKVGGLIDKPGKNRDYYHTCYSLSGLSVSQYFADEIVNICPTDESLLNKIHPIFNIGYECALNATNYFKKNYEDSKIIDIDS
jgi:protein farnesyltransferase subunit beta